MLAGNSGVNVCPHCHSTGLMSTPLVECLTSATGECPGKNTFLSWSRRRVSRRTLISSMLSTLIKTACGASSVFLSGEYVTQIILTGTQLLSDKNCNTTSSFRARSFENRLSLPSKWRGVRDSELEAVSGIKGATFVHAGYIYSPLFHIGHLCP